MLGTALIQAEYRWEAAPLTCGRVSLAQALLRRRSIRLLFADLRPSQGEGADQRGA